MGAKAKSVECKALEKLTLDVAEASREVRIEVGGLGEVSRAWDPVACDPHEESTSKPGEAGDGALLAPKKTHGRASAKQR